MKKKIRLAKIICHSGYCSRTEAEKIIKMGRVTIDDNPYAEFVISNSQIGSCLLYTSDAADDQ